MQLLYILGLFSIYMRLTLSWSVLRRNSEILQHERNWGKRPEFLIWRFPFQDIAGKEFDPHAPPHPGWSAAQGRVTWLQSPGPHGSELGFVKMVSNHPQVQLSRCWQGKGKWNLTLASWKQKWIPSYRHVALPARSLYGRPCEEAWPGQGEWPREAGPGEGCINLGS